MLVFAGVADKSHSYYHASRLESRIVMGICHQSKTPPFRAGFPPAAGPAPRSALLGRPGSLA